MKDKKQLETEILDFLQKKQFLISELNKLDGIILYLQNELVKISGSENQNSQPI